MSVNSNIKLVSNPKVKDVFYAYPIEIKTKTLQLRELVLRTADNIEGLETLEETLKWGESSYITKHRSTLRMHWKPKNQSVRHVF